MLPANLFRVMDRRPLHVLLLLMVPLNDGWAAQGQGFDVTTLSQRGFSPDIADFFNEMRFLPGRHQVTVVVNRAQTYPFEALFDERGQLCAEPALMETLKLRETLSPTGPCVAMTDRWPQAQVVLQPGAFRVEMTLPESAFDPQKISGDERGGSAAVLNYDISAQRFSGTSGSEQTLQAMLTPGLNVSNWVVRNRSYYSQRTGERRLDINETAARRVLPAMNALLEVGQFGAGGTLFSGLPMSGVQVTNASEARSGRLLLPVNGLANSQATVEVRQRGSVVYRTLVAPGPFVLTQLGNAVGGVDTEVEITESDGSKRVQTIIPQFMDEGDREPDAFQFGLGRYRAPGSRGLLASSPQLLTGERVVSRRAHFRSVWGGVLASPYQAVMGNNDIDVPGAGRISTGLAYAHSRQGRHGGQVDARWFSAPTPAVALSFTSLYRTQDYLGPDEGMDVSRQENASQGTLRLSLGGSASWGHPTWGRVTYGVYQNHYYQGESSVTQLLSASRQVGAGSVNLNLQRSALDPFSLFVGASWPLGGQRMGARVQQRHRQTMTSGMSLQGQSDAGSGYGLDVVNDRSHTELSGNLQVTTPYSQLSGGATHNDRGGHSFSAGASGALAYVNGTAVVSPYPAGETVGLVQMEGGAGTRLSVPGSGAVTTDFRGNALLPALPTYTEAQIRVDTQALPLNLRLNSTSAVLRMAYGSVVTRRFTVTEVRQLLLTVVDSHGEPLGVGASVHDERGRFMGTLMSGGALLLVNDDIGKSLEVRAVNLAVCRVSYRVPAYFDPQALYEETAAVCQ